MACDDDELAVKAYLGYDNALIVTPFSDKRLRYVYDMSDVSEVVAVADLTSSESPGDAVSANSIDDAQVVWFNDDVGDGEWRIYVRVGKIPAIVAGSYYLRLIIKTGSAPDGVVFDEDYRVDVVDAL